MSDAGDLQARVGRRREAEERVGAVPGDVLTA
jgi:hypothetical protein